MERYAISKHKHICAQPVIEDVNDTSLETEHLWSAKLPQNCLFMACTAQPLVTWHNISHIKKSKTSQRITKKYNNNLYIYILYIYTYYSECMCIYNYIYVYKINHIFIWYVKIYPYSLGLEGWTVGHGWIMLDCFYWKRYLLWLVGSVLPSPLPAPIPSVCAHQSKCEA